MTDQPAYLTLQGVNSPTFRCLPLDGTISWPEILQHHAQHSPHHPFAVYSDYEGCTQTIYYPQLWRAIARVRSGFLASTGLRENPQQTGEDTADSSARESDPPVVGVLANSDGPTYAAVVSAIICSGMTAFPISTRNSPQAVAHLLKQTKTGSLLISADPAMQKLARDAVTLLTSEGVRVELLLMPSFDAIYTESAEGALELPIVVSASPDSVPLILHSSGSTAFPKPIRLTKKKLFEWAMMPYDGEVDLCGMRFSIHGLPMFHAMGLGVLTWAGACGVTLAFFRPSVPPIVPTPEALFEGMVSCGCNAVICVPSVLEAWYHTFDSLQVLIDLKIIVFAGAPMNSAIGDRLAQAGVNLVSLYGATETAALSFGLYDREKGSRTAEDWSWFHLSTRRKTHMVPYDEKERLYEIVAVETPWSQPSAFNTTVDGKRAYATSDILQRHPTKPGLWQVYGRSDDQLMLSTGEKTNPVPLEAMMLEDPSIHCAIMFGRGRLQNGVLIQPVESFDPEDELRLAEFRNKIWPTIEKVNHFAPAHSRLFKEMIIVTPPSKPFEFTPKGNPRRAACIAAYTQEIDAVYAKVEHSSQGDLSPPEQWTGDAVLRFVRTVVNRVMTAPVRDDDDIFQYGCDSLQATWIRNSILHAIRESAALSTHKVSQNVVYAHPTIRALSEHAHEFVSAARAGREHAGKPSEDDMRARTAAMLTMVDKYSSTRITQHPPPAQTFSAADGRTVLVTGTTGRLGSQLLTQLLQRPDVWKVYAVNREKSGSDATLAARQKDAFDTFGLDVSLLSSDKLVMCAAAFDKENVGLKEDRYREICATVDSVVHNAWRVDFNLTLSSLEPLIVGVRNLVALCQNGARAPKMTFVSSISVFRSTPAPEAPIEEPQWSAGGGYSESKWVAENVIAQAGIDALIVRVGQLSGDTVHGAWSPQEWVPALLSASQSAGCVPLYGDEPNISWLPVDVAATALLQAEVNAHSVAGEAATRPRCRYMHLTCPARTSWNSVFGEYARQLGLPLVPYTDWVARATGPRADKDSERSSADRAVTGSAGTRNAAQHLSEFFAQGFGDGIEPRIATEHAVALAPVLADKRPVGEDDARRSVGYWRRIGCLT
ncbi:acetyl-CoA synthetase-like protein [Daedaleopsis nitida]|nr:acetyl-CoA synthetase-like protein [Daedaleopsis nitida]